jgi:ABC-type dipeptide/oligopeptide/nickel transport system permease subunit
LLLKAQITITAIIIIAIIGIAIAAPLLAPYEYDQTDFKNALSEPSQKNLMGTDQEGRDLLSRVIYGSRVSITVAIGTALIALLIGTAYGAISGYMGGRIDEAMMRVVDIFYSLPDLLRIVLITLIIGRGRDSARARPHRLDARCENSKGQRAPDKRGRLRSGGKGSRR